MRSRGLACDDASRDDMRTARPRKGDSSGWIREEIRPEAPPLKGCIRKGGLQVLFLTFSIYGEKHLNRSFGCRRWWSLDSTKQCIGHVLVRTNVLTLFPIPPCLPASFGLLPYTRKEFPSGSREVKSWVMSTIRQSRQSPARFGECCKLESSICVIKGVWWGFSPFPLFRFLVAAAN